MGALNGGGQVKSNVRASDPGSILFVNVTSMQSPAFARRINGSTGVPGFSKSPLRSSLRTYMIPINEPSQLLRGPRSLKINSPCVGLLGTGVMLASAFCAVTAVMLKLRCGAFAGQVA